MSAQHVVIITGTSSGIGAAVARLAARQGSSVVLVARRREPLEALAAEITADGGRALAITADITSLADQEAIIARTLQTFGAIHCLINNAGMPLPTDFGATDVQDIQRQWQTNVTALATLTRLALPEIKHQQGMIINIGSAISRVALPRLGNYGPTKIAVTAFTKALRREVSIDGVRVCLVEPGPVNTEFGELAGMQTNGITPEMCARAIVRLFKYPRKRIVVPGWLDLPLRVFGALEVLAPGLLDLAFFMMYRRERQQQRNAALQQQHQPKP